MTAAPCPTWWGRRGCSCPRGIRHALAAALARFLDEPGLWAQLREAGLRNVDRFSWASVADQQRDLYERAVARG